MRDEPLSLFAAKREARTIAEQQPDVELPQMTEGHNVIEDYSHTGLTLREHPLSFLRRNLSERRIVTCQEAMSARGGRWLMTAGLVLVRQKPGSEKGGMFITIEDETWPRKCRRLAETSRAAMSSPMAAGRTRAIVRRRPCGRATCS